MISTDEDAANNKVLLARGVLKRFLEAWNSHDAKTLGSCFRVDGDFVNVFLQKVSGRWGIEQMHRHPFDTVMSHALLEEEKLEVRDIDAHTVTFDLWWRVTGATSPDGSPVPERRGLMYLVTEIKDGEALFVALRNLDSDNRLSEQMR